MKILKNENTIVLQNDDFIIIRDGKKFQKIECESGVMVINYINYKELEGIKKNYDYHEIQNLVLRNRKNGSIILKTLYRNPLEKVIKIEDIKI